MGEPIEGGSEFTAEAVIPKTSPQDTVSGMASSIVDRVKNAFSVTPTAAVKTNKRKTKAQQAKEEESRASDFVSRVAPILSMAAILVIGFVVRDGYEALIPTNPEMDAITYPAMRLFARQFEIASKLDENGMDWLALGVGFLTYGARAVYTYRGIKHAQKQEDAATNSRDTRSYAPGGDGNYTANNGDAFTGTNSGYSAPVPAYASRPNSRDSRNGVPDRNLIDAARDLISRGRSSPAAYSSTADSHVANSSSVQRSPFGSASGAVPHDGSGGYSPDESVGRSIINDLLTKDRDGRYRLGLI